AEDGIRYFHVTGVQTCALPICYRSFNRPNPKTATNEGYLNHILEVGHESVLEHSSATFYIEASRSVLTELERHRHLSFSVVSQRSEERRVGEARCRAWSLCLSV